MIPKGTKVYVNIFDIHMNQGLWGPEPVEDFVPERSVDKKTNPRLMSTEFLNLAWKRVHILNSKVQSNILETVL